MPTPTHISITQPGLADAIRRPRVMALWERLRRHRRAASASEIAALCSYGKPEAQVALDLLEQAALVRKRKASRGRRTALYETAVTSISVLVDLRDPVHAEIVHGLERYMKHDLEDAQFRNEAPITSVGRGFWRFHHCSPLLLDASDLRELKQRIARVEEFIRLLNDKQSAAGDMSGCNHAISIRVAPLRGRVMPQPHVEVVSHDIDADRRSARVAPPHALSRREREAVLALRDGHTRAAVAKRLGISVLTVGTICKRAYRKLGIHRASQLHDISID